MQKGVCFMRKKYSIGFLILTIVTIFLLVFVYRISYQKALLDMETELLEEYTDLEECYYIKGSDGYVTVYLADGETVYEYTSIPMGELPESIQAELQDGKKVYSIRQVYGFLENYSS